MSQLRVDEITDELGTGSPAFPNGTPGFPLTSSDMPAGSVIQVVQTVKTSSYLVTLAPNATDTQNVPGLDTSIKPISQNSKILFMFYSGDGRNAGALNFGPLLFKDGSLVTDAVGTGPSGAAAQGLTAGGGNNGAEISFAYMDSPNTTSTVTYGIRLKSVRSDINSNASVGLVNDGSGTLVQVATKLSTITLMEIAG